MLDALYESADGCVHRPRAGPEGRRTGSDSPLGWARCRGWGWCRRGLGTAGGRGTAGRTARADPEEIGSYGRQAKTRTDHLRLAAQYLGWRAPTTLELKELDEFLLARGEARLTDVVVPVQSSTRLVEIVHLSAQER